MGVSDGKGEAVAGVPPVGEGLWRCPRVQPGRPDQFERLCVASRVSPCARGFSKSCYFAVPFRSLFSPFAAPGGCLLLVQPMRPILIVTCAELLFSMLVIAPLKSIKSSVGFHPPFVSSAAPFPGFSQAPLGGRFQPQGSESDGSACPLLRCQCGPRSVWPSPTHFPPSSQRELQL